MEYKIITSNLRSTSQYWPSTALISSVVVSHLLTIATEYSLTQWILGIGFLAYWYSTLIHFKSLNLLSSSVMGFYGLVPTTYYLREIILRTPYEGWVEITNTTEQITALVWYLTSMVCLHIGIISVSKSAAKPPDRFLNPGNNVGRDGLILLTSVGICSILVTKYLLIRTTEWAESSTREDLRRAMLTFGLVPPLILLSTRKDSIPAIVSFTILAGTLTAMAATGSRRLFVTAVIAAGACALMQRGKQFTNRQTANLVVLAIFAYAAMNVLGVIRQKIQRGEIRTVQEALATHPQEILPMYGVHEGIMFFSFNYFLRTHHEIGAFLGSFVSELIPSFVRAENIHYVTVTDYINRHCYPFYGHNDTDIGVFLPTEIMLNGGIPTLIIVSTLIGGLVAWFERFNTASSSITKRYIYFLLVAYSAHFVYYNRTLLVKFLIVGIFLITLFTLNLRRHSAVVSRTT
jgi:hypothetical protein